jgi:hypothetical protein
MVFKGTPNQYVRFSNKTVIRVTGKKGFYFNENGEYETDNDLLCRVLKQHFEVENSATGDKPAEEKIFKCKHCDYTTTNKGLLMAHYREHKKEV